MKILKKIEEIKEALNEEDIHPPEATLSMMMKKLFLTTLFTLVLSGSAFALGFILLD